MPFRPAQGPAKFATILQKVLGWFNDLYFFYMDNILLQDSKGYPEHLKINFKEIKSRSDIETIQMCFL